MNNKLIFLFLTISTIFPIVIGCGGALIAKSVIAIDLQGGIAKRSDNLGMTGTGTAFSTESNDVFDSMSFPGGKLNNHTIAPVPVDSEFAVSRHDHKRSLLNVEAAPNVTGKLSTLITFNIGKDDVFCFDVSEPAQVAGKGFVELSTAINYQVSFKEFRYKYTFNDEDIVCADVEVQSECYCDCPWGENICHSTTNTCGSKSKNDCVNKFFADQDPSGCAITSEPSESCCALFIKSCIDYYTYSLSSTPTRHYIIKVVKTIGTTAKTLLFYGQVGNIMRFNVDGVQLTVSGQFASNVYSKGDRVLLQSPSSIKLIDEWNTVNGYQKGKGGWIHVQDNMKKYDPTELSNTMAMTTTHCRNDEFSKTYSYHKSSVASELSIVSYLAPYGTVNIGNNHLNITASNYGAMQISMILNETDVKFMYKLLGVNEYNCNATANSISGGSLRCNTTSCEDFGQFKFWTQTEDRAILETRYITCSKDTTSYWEMALPVLGTGTHTIEACTVSSISGELCIDVTYDEQGRVKIVPSWVEQDKDDTITSSTTNSIDNGFFDFLENPLGGWKNVFSLMLFIGILCLIAALIGVSIWVMVKRGVFKKLSDKIQMSIIKKSDKEYKEGYNLLSSNPELMTDATYTELDVIQDKLSKDKIVLASAPMYPDMNNITSPLGLYAKPSFLASNEEKRRWNFVKTRLDNFYRLPAGIVSSDYFEEFQLGKLYTISPTKNLIAPGINLENVNRLVAMYEVPIMNLFDYMSYIMGDAVVVRRKESV